MTKQVRTKNTTLMAVIRRKAFRLGAEHYTKGKAPTFDAFGTDTNTAWAYERGRLFGAWARSRGEVIPRAFVNRKLSWQFIAMAHDALRDRAFR